MYLIQNVQVSMQSYYLKLLNIYKFAFAHAIKTLYLNIVSKFRFMTNQVHLCPLNVNRSIVFEINKCEQLCFFRQ